MNPAPRPLTRILTISLLSIISIFTLYTLSTLASPFTMTEYTSDNDPLANLHLFITSKPSSPPSESILTITLRNTSPDTPYTVFTWDTPLDPLALSLGSFKIVKLPEEEEIHGPQLRLNRILPPPDDAYLEVLAGGEISRDIKLDKEWIPKHFRIRGQGNWRAIWRGRKAGIARNVLEEMRGDLEGEIGSEEVEVNLEPEVKQEQKPAQEQPQEQKQEAV